ncbi:MAG: hypothetical protein IKZ53_01075 [Selenomonadaceae bacterium]|nr:hypothetical protein [Selenomonadaceae bacterium]
MSDKTIKHFIISRFFNFQRKGYPHNVLDVDFLSKQLPLAKNMLKSLENQTNKNFELVFFVNDKFVDDTKYEFIFSTLRDSTTLPLKFVKWADILRLVKEAYDNYDFVIQSRIDFDDFIFKDAIADTQSKVDDCENILSYGYCDGYEYICGELYIYDIKWGGIGHHSILQSLIIKSSFGKNLPFVYPYNFDHTKAKLNLKEFLEKNSMKFSDNMFQQNLSSKAYIYFRHEFSQQLLVTNSTLKLPNKKKLTTADITKKQLEEEFGFFYDLNSIK